MFCPSCGQENLDTASTCIRCGAAMPNAASLGGYAPVRSTDLGPPIGNNLVWAILATISCCIPTGIVAIVYAAQVDSTLAAGDRAGALRSAQLAATWSWVSFGLALLGIVCYMGLFAVAAFPW